MDTDTTTWHYFGSTAFGWKKAQTRAEILEALAKQAGSDIIKRNLKPSGGLYCWICLVKLPQSTNYGINFFQPTVPWERGQEFNIVNVKGHAVPIDREVTL